MFDDLNEKNKGAQNLSGFKSIQDAPAQKAEDMFSEVETGAGFNPPEKPNAFKPKEPAEQIEEYVEDDGHKAQKVFVLVAIILGVALIAVGGVWAFRYYSVGEIFNSKEAVQEPSAETIKQEDATPVKKIEAENIPAAEEETAPAATDEPQPEETLTQDAVDTDQDGLSDEEENILGSKIDDTDSDDDGLFDREEVEVYDTNPSNPDTDGDTYTDGSEVAGGYNPNGDGKLYEIK